MYGSVALNTLTLLCNRHTIHLQNFFQVAKLTLCAQPPPLVTLLLLSLTDACTDHYMESRSVCPLTFTLFALQSPLTLRELKIL